MAPGDVRQTVEQMLQDDWGVVDAADGFLLLRRGAEQKEIPEEFYTFVRTSNSTTRPSPLTFVDVTAFDWPRWRTTAIETRWDVGEDFDAATMMPQIAVLSPAGDTLYRFADAYPPGLVWYPPELWQAGDEISISTLPLALPADWAVAVDTAPWLAIPDAVLTSALDRQALVGVYTRGEGDQLAQMPIDLLMEPAWENWFASQAGESLSTNDFVFRTPDGAEIALQTSIQDGAYWPGGVVDLWLDWAGETGWPEGQSVFVHLRAGDTTITQSDGAPRFYILFDANAALAQYGMAADWRQLTIPAADDVGSDVQELTLVVGMYNPETGQRSDAYADDGEALGQEVVVGRINLEAPPTPDQACALIPETCASQR